MSIRLIANPENRKVKVQIKNIVNYSKKGIRKGFYYLGKDLTKESQRLIKDPPKTGRIYRLRKGGRIVRHQASAPGQPPANFTGSLRKSIDFIVRGTDQMEFGSRLYFPDRKGTPEGVKYGKYLELGTRKMAKRPFLLPAIKTNQRNAVTHFETQMKAALKRGKL
jgi:HK97 gp10 family phage protein